MPFLLRWKTVWLTATWLLLLPAALWAQPATTPTTSKPAADTPPKAASGTAEDVREAKPDIFYLKDKDGRLVPVPDFSYEDFKRLYDLDKNLAAAANTPPAHSLQVLTVTGKTEEGNAKLSVSCKILIKKDGWVRIPLRFPNAVLREPPKWDGPGTQFTDYDREGDGYVFWVNGRDDKPHNLKFDMVVPLRRNGDELRLSFAAPRATSSEMQYQVAGQPAAPRLNEAASLVETTHPNTKLTSWKILGVSGDFQLAWNEGSSAKVAKLAAVLETRGTVLVRVEGRRRITAEARLKVNSFGGPIESFRVRLPPNMELLPLNEPGYSVSLAGESTDDDGTLVREVAVELDSKTAVAVDVRLRAVLRSAQDMTMPYIPTGGFEVLGSVSQFGVVDLAVDGDWNVSWQVGSNVHRLDELPELQKQQKVVARFEYDRQPYSLKIQIQPRKTDLAVEPRHVVQVSAERLTLETTLKCRVRGARAESVEIDLNGWKVDQIQPDKLVQIELLNLDATQPLTIPLSSMAAGMSEFELKLFAFRDIETKESSVSFSLPRARASSQRATTLVVIPNDNVELTPRSGEIQGLIAEPDPPAISLPPRQQASLFFRDRGSATAPVFVADRKVHSRTLAAVLQHRFHIDRSQIAVEQRFQFRVAYEPLKSVLFNVPAALLEDDNLQFFWEIAPHQLAPLETEREDASADNPDADSKRRVVRVFLGEDRIGAVSLLARYVTPLDGLELDQDRRENVPLVRLAADEKANVSSETLQIAAATGIDVRLDNSEWQRGLAEDTNSPDDLVFTSTVKPLAVPLVLKLTRPLVSLATVVHKAWVQTWLTDRWRHDRAAFQLTTSEDELEFDLPAGARTEGLVAAIDGHAANFVFSEPGRVRLETPTHGDSAEFVVELSYVMPVVRTKWGMLDCEFPRPAVAATSSFFRWQLKLAGGEHLSHRPSNLTPELTWRWRDVFFDRQASLSQRDLEQWVGASAQATVADDETNQYLFSAFGDVERAEIRASSRSTIVLLVSGVLLVAGTLLMYVPVLRHPVLLVVIALLISGGLFMAPEFTLLAGQAGILGLLLIALARVLRTMVARHGHANTVIRATPISAIESKVTAQRVLRAEGSSYGTTATAPGHVPFTAPEPKP